MQAIIVLVALNVSLHPTRKIMWRIPDFVFAFCLNASLGHVDLKISVPGLESRSRILE